MIAGMHESAMFQAVYVCEALATDRLKWWTVEEIVDKVKHGIEDAGDEGTKIPGTHKVIETYMRIAGLLEESKDAELRAMEDARDKLLEEAEKLREESDKQEDLYNCGKATASAYKTAYKRWEDSYAKWQKSDSAWTEARKAAEANPKKKYRLAVASWDQSNPFQRGNGNDGEVVANLKDQVSRQAKLIIETRKEIEFLKNEKRVTEVHIKDGKKTVKKVTGHFHAQFEDVLTLAKARRNIFLYGPAGCGKSTLCEQVAEALHLKFYFISCTAGMTEGSLTGRLLPVGAGGKWEFMTPEFVKAYETGGVFFFDELDASDANVMIVVHAALDGSKIAIPNRVKKPYAEKHPDFVCIAACNTWGLGSDRQYSGRNKLDMATLDRFGIGKIAMDYDSVIETAICPDPELRQRYLKYRKAVNDASLERCVSTRFIRDAHIMVSEYGWDVEKVDAALFKGWRSDEIYKVKNA